MSDAGPQTSIEPFSIAESSIADVGIYEENGAIVFGVSAKQEWPFHALILQIDTDESDQRRDAWGMYAEVDGEGAYDAVEGFDFDQRTAVLRIVLRAPSLATARPLLVHLAAVFGPEDRFLLARMVQTFKAYPKLAGQ